MRVVITPELPAWSATAPAASTIFAAAASGAVAGRVASAASPRSTAVTRLTVCSALRAKGLSMPGRSRVRPIAGTLTPSVATSRVRTLVSSVAAIRTAASLPATVPAPVCRTCPVAATETRVSLSIDVFAFLMKPLTASSAIESFWLPSVDVRTAPRSASPFRIADIVSAVSLAASVMVSAPGRTRPIALMTTFACVSAASFTVPPFTAPWAPTVTVEVFFCLTETSRSCEARVEVRVAELTTLVVSAASPAVSIRPARLIVAAVVASTDSLAAPAFVSPLAIVVEPVTWIATEAPPITAFWLTTTPILAVLVTSEALPVVVRTGATVAPAVKTTPSLARI
ncbi:hypothetical protein CHKEEEPN_1643 [Methylorubrum podarium]|nr:hypothetical protein CHKEEEPN_1643 [Methylorubrum podarium]